jgi:hypothetical protein
MTRERPQRLTLILGLSTGIVLLMAGLTVQVLSRQPPDSGFRIIWAGIGLSGLVITAFNARLLRAQGRRHDDG